MIQYMYASRDFQVLTRFLFHRCYVVVDYCILPYLHHFKTKAHNQLLQLTHFARSFIILLYIILHFFIIIIVIIIESNLY